MKKGFLLPFLLLLAFPPPSNGQDFPLRGIIADFPNFPHDGSPYWEKRPFEGGSVFMDNHLYTDVALQIDAQVQEVIVGIKGYPPFYPGKERIVWFTRGEDLFVNLRYWDQNAPEGFFRLLGEGQESFWFEQTRKYLNTGVKHTFSARTRYYRLHHGEFARTSRRSVRNAVTLEEASRHLLACLRLPDSRTNVPQENSSPSVTSRPADSVTVALPSPSLADSSAWREHIRSSHISAEQVPVYKSALTGMVKVSAKELARIPTPLGEKDPLKALLSLPGVKSVGESSGGLNIRGGGADQNLILLDENTLLGTGHLFGMLSSLNPDLVGSVELFAGAVPAEYGSRVSSVLDISLRDGTQERIKGSSSLGLMTSRAHIEGPLGEKLSFIAGARASYSNYLLRILPPQSAYHGGQAHFGDVTARLTFRPDSLNTIRTSFYASGDSFSFSPDTVFAYSNLNASVAWKHFLPTGGFLNISLGYDQYENSYQQADNDFSSFRLTRNIRQVFLKPEMQTSIRNHFIKYGSGIIGFWLQTGERVPLRETSLVSPLSLNKQCAAELALYFSDFWTISPRSALDMGFRANLYAGRNALYFIPELRLSGKYSAGENLTLKGGIGNMSQNLHTVSNATSISPMDSWTLSSQDIRPTQGIQASSGMVWDFPTLGLQLSLEAYGKWFIDAVDYCSGASIIMNDNLDADLLPVQGKAWGAELMIRRRTGKITGWASYTYSRTAQRDASEDSSQAINGGAWYPTSYDKPHEVKIAANYALPAVTACPPTWNTLPGVPSQFL